MTTDSELRNAHHFDRFGSAIAYSKETGETAVVDLMARDFADVNWRMAVNLPKSLCAFEAWRLDESHAWCCEAWCQADRDGRPWRIQVVWEQVFGLDEVDTEPLRMAGFGPNDR
jgi:hypothetical protein